MNPGSSDGFSMDVDLVVLKCAYDWMGRRPEAHSGLSIVKQLRQTKQTGMACSFLAGNSILLHGRHCSMRSVSFLPCSHSSQPLIVFNHGAQSIAAQSLTGRAKHLIEETNLFLLEGFLSFFPPCFHYLTSRKIAHLGAEVVC